MIARYWWGKGGRKGIIGCVGISSVNLNVLGVCWGGGGFKNFETFTKGTVTKQSWRLQENPSSLVARILKARYFPHANFLDAMLGSSPSLVWGLILWGHQIIEEGLVWRVWNGFSIRVF